MKNMNGVILFLIICLLLGAVNYSQNYIKAEIGVKIISSTDGIRSERSSLAFDRLRSRDNLQVFIYPEKDCLLYLVHYDNSNSTLILKDTLKSKVLYILPATDSTFTVDGTSSKENLTILLSPIEIEEVEKYFSSDNTLSESWKKHEKLLTQKSSVMQDETPGQRISMAGNIRGKSELSLKLYSGKDILIKTYSFDVKI